jgi:hypothetical protein
VEEKKQKGKLKKKRRRRKKKGLGWPSPMVSPYIPSALPTWSASSWFSSSLSLPQAAPRPPPLVASSLSVSLPFLPPSVPVDSAAAVVPGSCAGAGGARRSAAAAARWGLGRWSAWCRESLRPRYCTIMRILHAL